MQCIMGLDLSRSGKVLPDLATFPKTAVCPDWSYSVVVNFLLCQCSPSYFQVETNIILYHKQELTIQKMFVAWCSNGNHSLKWVIHNSTIGLMDVLLDPRLSSWRFRRVNREYSTNIRQLRFLLLKGYIAKDDLTHLEFIKSKESQI